VNAGHCNPQVIAAAKAQMEKLVHCYNDRTSIRMEIILLSLLTNSGLPRLNRVETEEP
jgi:4-aminobutyrate aminotransferase-like enzyme